MGTNSASLVADLFLFCYEKDFMNTLTKEKRFDLIDAFNSTSRYLAGLLNIDNIHFEHMVHIIYPAELQLNEANASDTESAFLDLILSIHNNKVSAKIYDKYSLMAMTLDDPLMVYIYLNIFALPSLHFELVEKISCQSKKMQQGICNPEFYGDLVYKFKKINGNQNFSNLFKRIVNRFKRAGYTLDIVLQTASLVLNPIMVEGYAALFSCTVVVQA